MKWILPPRTAGDFYLYDKWFATTMGYETVENDDLSLPRPPTLAPARAPAPRIAAPSGEFAGPQP